MDLYSILIVVLIFQGVFNLTLLSINYKKEKKARFVYLFFITLLMIWFLAEFLSVRNAFKIDVNVFYGSRYGSWFLFGPLTYLFFKSIIKTDYTIKLVDSLHFLPFVFFTLLIPWLSNESLSYRQIHYGMLAVFDYRPKKTTPFEYLYSTIFYLQFIHLSIYLLFNLMNINLYSKNLKKEYSQIKNILWIKSFNLLLILILVLVSSYVFILFESDQYERSLDYIYVLPLGIFIYAISYKISSQNWLPITEAKRYKTSTLNSELKYTYKLALEKLMQKEKPFLQNDLRLKDIANSLSIKTHHISQTINEEFHLLFFDFINQYRIAEAIDIMKTNPKDNLLQIAFKSGFNNKTSFINAFKKFKNQTPSNFRKRSL